MPRKFTITHDVLSARGAGPSGRALARELRERGYDGPVVNWGFGGLMPPVYAYYNDSLAVSRASNKRVALDILRAAGVPCPRAFPREGNSMLVYDEDRYPIVGRADRHRAGSSLWVCRNPGDIYDAEDAGATHFMEFIEQPELASFESEDAIIREFRVHVAFGLSIKLTEKMWRGEGEPDGVTRTHGTGWVQVAPQPHAGKRRLREVAKDAVSALGLDFGAVDIITRRSVENELEVFVLEVNTAPRLTDPLSDTLGRYASAFLGRPTE